MINGKKVIFSFHFYSISKLSLAIVFWYNVFIYWVSYCQLLYAFIELYFTRFPLTNWRFTYFLIYWMYRIFLNPYIKYHAFKSRNINSFIKNMVKMYFISKGYVIQSIIIIVILLISKINKIDLQYEPILYFSMLILIFNYSISFLK